MQNKEDYTFYYVHEFADKLEERIVNNVHTRQHSEDTIMTLKKLARHMKSLAMYMREVEWLCRGQITEEEFHERVKKI